jgi:hypothetical protein
VLGLTEKMLLTAKPSPSYIHFPSHHQPLPDGIETDNPDRLSSIGAVKRIPDLDIITSQAANSEITKMPGSAVFSTAYRLVLLPTTIYRPI